MSDPNDFMQVIEHLENGKIRVYNIVSHHLADENDPLTTIEIDGYEDVIAPQFDFDNKEWVDA